MAEGSVGASDETAVGPGVVTGVEAGEAGGGAVGVEAAVALGEPRAGAAGLSDASGDTAGAVGAGVDGGVPGMLGDGPPVVADEAHAEATRIAANASAGSRERPGLSRGGCMIGGYQPGDDDPMTGGGLQLTIPTSFGTRPRIVQPASSAMARASRAC